MDEFVDPGGEFVEDGDGAPVGDWWFAVFVRLEWPYLAHSIPLELSDRGGVVLGDGDRFSRFR